MLRLARVIPFGAGVSTLKGALKSIFTYTDIRRVLPEHQHSAAQGCLQFPVKQNICKCQWYNIIYYINCSVLQGFLPPKNVVSEHT